VPRTRHALELSNLSVIACALRTCFSEEGASRNCASALSRASRAALRPRRIEAYRDVISFPAYRYFIRQGFEPDARTSRYSPRSSNILRSFSPQITFRQAVSVSKGSAPADTPDWLALG
jgi:hypothetical protein